VRELEWVVLAALIVVSAIADGMEWPAIVRRREPPAATPRRAFRLVKGSASTVSRREARWKEGALMRSPFPAAACVAGPAAWGPGAAGPGCPPPSSLGAPIGGGPAAGRGPGGGAALPPLPETTSATPAAFAPGSGPKPAGPPPGPPSDPPGRARPRWRCSR